MWNNLVDGADGALDVVSVREGTQQEWRVQYLHMRQKKGVEGEINVEGVVGRVKN